MTDQQIRQQLIDYLFDELTETDRERMEAELARDANLRRQLKVLEARFGVLPDRDAEYDPPTGLVSGAMAALDAFEEERRARRPEHPGEPEYGDPEHKVTPARLNKLSPSKQPPRRAYFRLADVVTAAGICIVACMLFFPAIANSRFQTQINLCQDNLRRVGMALQVYNGYHQGLFPLVASEGRMSFAGSYAMALKESELVSDSSIFLCSAAPQSERSLAWRVPNREEVEAAQGSQLAELQLQAGGSYGYTLGYFVNNEYRPTVNQGRSNFAVMADAPAGPVSGSRNHLGKGHNVLYEDFHVEYVTEVSNRAGDPYFENRWGLQAAGVDIDDAVIGSSAASPVIFSGQ